MPRSARKSAPTTARSPKAGRPPREVTPSPQVKRRRRSVQAAVKKDTTLLQTDRGPRARWPASRPAFKKR
jgi:hypothetical protein